MCVCVCARREDLLGKNGKKVAFSEVECEVAGVYVSGVLVLGVPGTGVRNSEGGFPRCDLLRVLHLRERIHGDPRFEHRISAQRAGALFLSNSLRKFLRREPLSESNTFFDAPKFQRCCPTWLIAHLSLLSQPLSPLSSSLSISLSHYD